MKTLRLALKLLARDWKSGELIKMPGALVAEKPVPKRLGVILKI